MLDRITEGMVASLKRKLALAQAEYRHAWDYENETQIEAAYERVLHFASRHRVFELVLEYSRKRFGEVGSEQHPFFVDLERLISNQRATFVSSGELRLPRRT